MAPLTSAQRNALTVLLLVVLSAGFHTLVRYELLQPGYAAKSMGSPSLGSPPPSCTRSCLRSARGWRSRRTSARLASTSARSRPC